ncbi:MAG: hypothetical protein HYT12_00325 [Candidatus Liptonbacteria bacterium]|nr:hypothetical protein [Candidatus Liptonbacteria bacterium]
MRIMQFLRLKKTKSAPRRVLDVRNPLIHNPKLEGKSRFDFGKESEREIGFPPQKNFYWRKATILTSLSGALIVALFLYTTGLTRADVQQFYAGKCLGSWQNPQFAEGMTETTIGTSTFSNENSATLTPSASSSEQIFCGGFLPPDYEAKGVIDHIALSFVWNLEFPPLAVSSSSEDVATTTATVEFEATTTEPELTPTSWLLHYLFPRAMAEGEETVEPAPAETTIETTAETTTETTTAAPAEEQALPDQAEITTETAPDETMPEPSDTNNVGATTTTEAIVGDGDVATTTVEDIENIATTTIEDETGSSGTPSKADVATETTSTMEESNNENIGGEVLGVSSGDDATTTLMAATSTATSTEIADDINPTEGFLLIRYSLDGTNWFNLEQVNRDNWPDFTVSLPIVSWEEVENLQISITEVLGAEDRAEIVYFDGAVIEVHFDLPTFLGDVLPDVPVTKTIESLADTLDVLTGDDGQAEIIKEADPEKVPAEEPVILTREAKQRCEVKPFSGAVKRGGEAERVLTLWPSGDAIGSALNSGVMPKGLNVRFGADSIGNEIQEVPLYMFADKDARQGSFNVSTLYKESYSDGYISVASCKFNPVIE